MKIGVLTSSRADYGVYLPLLRKMQINPAFELELLVFGTHLSEKFGMTVRQIELDGFKVESKVETLPDDDKPSDIADSMAKTIFGFTKIWRNKKFDLVFALGDRYEMFAAVASAVPFNIPVAHLHGGETTLGAIDEVFRHSITCMSKIHFTATEIYKNRVIEITGSENNVYNVGALSIDGIKGLNLLTIDEFKINYGIDLAIPTILVTFHPETVDPDKNEKYIRELVAAMKEITGYQLVITMPNADTMGLMIRRELNRFVQESNNAIGVESFGSLGYLSCMSHCKMMLGNTSSGFIEAFYFQKPVVNLGNRQGGRIITSNIFNSPIEKSAILHCIHESEKFTPQAMSPIYGEGNAADKIIEILKNRTND